MATFSRRPLPAVRALEDLQQHERQAGGEQPLPQDYRASLREALRLQRISDQLDQGGLDMAIANAASLDEGIDEEVESRLHLWHLDDPTQWSRYERPDAVWTIADICSRVESLAASYLEQQRSGGDLTPSATNGTANWRLREPPVVGTLATGQIAAQTQRTQTGEIVILVDSGFFAFALMLAQMTTFALHDLRDRGKYSEPTIQLMSDIVALQSVVGTCLGTYPRKTPESVQTMVRSFEDAVEVFVISHEYAHLLNGDMDFHPMGSVAAPQDSARHRKELLADGKAFIMTVGAAQNFGMDGSGIFGPALYLAGRDVFDRAEAAFNHQPSVEYDSHYPSPFERMKGILTDIQGSEIDRAFGQELRLAEQSYNVILSVWDIVMPALWDAREELAQYKPRGNEPGYPNLMALSHASVETLWRHVKHRLH